MPTTRPDPLPRKGWTRLHPRPGALSRTVADSMRETISTTSRRQLLKWAGGILGTATVGATSVLLTSDTAAAGSTSTKFDLTAASSALFREITLQETHVLQSFSFDNTNK